jgi:HEAT repeat protein
LSAALDSVETGMLGPFGGTQSAIPRGPKRALFVRSVRELLQDSDPNRRAAVVDQLALKFGDAAAPLLIKLLDDESLRAGAAIHLGTLRRPEAAPRLVALLKDSPKEPGPIIEGLGGIGDETAVQPISRYLSATDQFETAALALARIGGAAAKRLLDGLFAQLERDPRQAARTEWLVKIRSKDFLEEDAGRRAAERSRYARE